MKVAVDTKVKVSVCAALFFAFGCAESIEEPDAETWQLEPEVVLLDEDEPAPTPKEDPVVTPGPITSEEPTPTPAPNPVEEPVEPTPNPVEPTPTPNETPQPALAAADCDFQQLWWQATPLNLETASVFAVSPDKGLLVRGFQSDYYTDWQVMSTSDGEVLAGIGKSRVYGLSDDFERFLTREYDTEADRQSLVVRRMGSNEQVFSAPADHGTSAMSADGSRVAHLSCERHPAGEGSVTTVDVWEVSSGRKLFSEQVIDEMACDYFTTNFDVQLDATGSRVAFLTGTHRVFDDRESVARVHLIQARGDEYRFLSAKVPTLEREFEGRHAGVVSSLRFHPNGRSLHVTSAGGLRTEFSSLDFSIISQQQQGAFLINQDAYTVPSPMSPIAWTRDAAVMASVAPDGGVELHGEDGELLQRIFAPEPSDIADWDVELPGGNAPVNIAFSPDGEVVTVGFRKGVGAWGCKDALKPQVSGLRSVSLQIPETIFTHQELPLDVVLEGLPTGPWPVYTLYLDGSVYASGSLPEDLRIAPYYTGAYQVRVVVTDGWGTVSSEPQPLRIINPR